MLIAFWTTKRSTIRSACALRQRNSFSQCKPLQAANCSSLSFYPSNDTRHVSKTIDHRPIGIGSLFLRLHGKQRKKEPQPFENQSIATKLLSPVKATLKPFERLSNTICVCVNKKVHHLFFHTHTNRPNLHRSAKLTHFRPSRRCQPNPFQIIRTFEQQNLHVCE